MALNGLDVLVRNIGIISRNNSVLASMLSHGESTEVRELRVLLQDSGQVARETGDLLLSLQQDVSRDADAAPSRQRSMLSKLNKDFQFVLRRFQQLAEQSAHHARSEDLEAAGGGMKPSLHSEFSHRDDGADDVLNESSPLLSDGDAGTLSQQQQRRHATSPETLAERERILSQVESTVVEVRDIFSDLAVLVADQTETMEHISEAIENTARKAHHASDELHDASRTQAAVRKRKCCIYIMTLLGSLLLMMILFTSRT